MDTRQIKTSPLPHCKQRLINKCRRRYRNYDNFVLSTGALIAYVRHCHTNYDHLISRKKANHPDVYIAIREQCNAIVKTMLMNTYGDDWQEGLG